MTAITRACGARRRRAWRLCSSAPVEIVARVARLTRASRRTGGSREAVLARQVVEPGQLAVEHGLDRADRAVALLADDHLGHATLGGVLVVDLVAVDERDEVGVLLDGARLAQV